MAIEGWLPIGFTFADGTVCGQAIRGALNWQIVQTTGGGRALLAREALTEVWRRTGLLDNGDLQGLTFGNEQLYYITSGQNQLLAQVADCRAPANKSEALAFASALRLTREIDKTSPLQDSIYVEKMSRLLPTFDITVRVSDDVVLGFWLTGGVQVSASAGRRLQQLVSWYEPKHVAEVLEAAGVFPSGESRTEIPAFANLERNRTVGYDGSISENRPMVFSLPGRQELERFFNEHVVDIVENPERYKALGIDFPAAVVLHGPPGCGKTFAVERLIQFLGWPSYQIDSSSVASPYIHETSRKVAAAFEKAIETAPSVLVIDEMEAFLADRASGGSSSHHRVEEVAEFLRRIPEAVGHQVLIVAMTNRIDMIDPAILRRGRFDHIIEVGYAQTEEIKALLVYLISRLPGGANVAVENFAARLSGRPLSDVAFVVREGARLSARAGESEILEAYLLAALNATPSRNEDESHRRIGFY